MELPAWKLHSVDDRMNNECGAADARRTGRRGMEILVESTFVPLCPQKSHSLTWG
jgi:hypothetical protein